MFFRFTPAAQRIRRTPCACAQLGIVLSDGLYCTGRVCCPEATHAFPAAQRKAV
ncbi:hypothetical protein HMPREF9123_0142 [Neisseria bacilliformis ATCC BAA-1200]|uniref:Uncharacterized protein n=1 Tax=Neisseria bacilliformis ATCC BAA-1200 TaxID=888742 RepID=F2B8W7_9NEIS|nr:hypothetical protein HMPREF9123_0142 [Neisseria bacilliformis ATCC BAA-1200]